MARRQKRGRRTNAADRSATPRDELIRWFIGPDQTPWPDWTGRSKRLGGRGAYTLPTQTSVERAVERRAFGRAFKARVAPVTADVLVERLVLAGTKVFFDRLGLANRAGATAVGQAAVSDRMQQSSRGLLLVSGDAGASTVRKYTENARRKASATAVVDSGHRLGEALGREFVSVAWIDAAPFADDVSRLAARLFPLPNTPVIEYEAAGTRYESPPSEESEHE